MRNQTLQFLRSLARDAARTAADALGIIVLMVLGAAAFCAACNLIGWGALAVLGEPVGTREDRIGWGFMVLACALVVAVLCRLAYLCVRDTRRWVADRWRRAGYKAKGYGDHPHA